MKTVGCVIKLLKCWAEEPVWFIAENMKDVLCAGRCYQSYTMRLVHVGSNVASVGELLS